MSGLVVVFVLIAAEPSAQERELLQTFRDEFIQITPGRGAFPKSFRMGDDSSAASRPVHQVQFDYDFLVAKYEVPQNLWEAVMGSNPSRWKGPRNSVENLTYDEATNFCQRVTEQLRNAGLIERGQQVRLPSEAEWEYVARAGTTSAYSFGDDQLGKYAWYTGNAAGNDPPVGAKEPNPWGLYDVHGYLWEWCRDPWHADYEGAPRDGSARSEGDAGSRILRGGSWKDQAEKLSSFYRRRAADKLRDDAVGLRCVLVDVAD